jgi:anti-sigma B factor antagonist
MNVIAKQVDGITIARVEARNLDATTARVFKAEVAPLLKPESRLVFDLSKVEYVDSTGLGVLVSSLRQVHSSHGDIKLCGLTKPVRALFELVRMHRIFEIFNEPQEAVDSFLASTQPQS